MKNKPHRGWQLVSSSKNDDWCTPALICSLIIVAMFCLIAMASLENQRKAKQEDSTEFIISPIINVGQ